jgi:tetratricopeptide (TPR) repeat protein
MTAKGKPDDEDACSKAIRSMTKLKSKLGSGLAHYYLGILHQWENDQKKARKVLEELLAAHPEFYEAHVELGDVEVHEKKPAAAIPHYERALAIYPHFEYGVDRMMTVLVELGRFAEAKTYVDRALLRGEDPLRLMCKETIRFELEGPTWEKGYKFESENYVIQTDVSEEFAAEIADSAELIRDVYDALFPEIAKPTRKYQVVVYKDRAGYLAAGAPPMSAGLYMSLPRRLMLYRHEKDVEETFMTLKHEGFHQYCHEYLENIPSWFNEGLADYFSASELVVTGKKRAMRILPNKKRLDYLCRALEARAGMPSLPSLMKMSQAQMYDLENGSKMAYLHYCQAWAICYFSIESGSDAYRGALKSYFQALRKGENQSRAYAKSFGGLNMKKFEEEWRDFMLGVWRSGRAGGN